MFERDPLSTLLLVLTAIQVAALAAAWLWVRRSATPMTTGMEPTPGPFSRLADRRPAAIALVFVTAFSFIALLALAHWPVPRIQDEFSYRLAGETFASGRLANPPHPMWPHLETEHVLQQPTYASKYPPMQGLVLAAGEVVAGEPMLGVWLSMGAAAAAVCWMFYAFLPARWALIGSLVVATHPWLLAWWGHSGWGGQMAMLGGALLYGSLKRILGAGRDGKPAATLAVLMGVGLAVLANTRPFEGFAASLPAAAALAWHLLRPGRPRLSVSVPRIILPAAAVLALTGAAMTTYNQAVTGDPLRLPYQLHNEQYSATPLFIWQDLPPEPDYGDRKLRDFHAGWERGIALDQRTPYGIAQKTMHKVIQFFGFYLGPALGLGIAGVWLRARPRYAPADARNTERRWVRPVAAAAAWTFGASLLCVWFNPHYVAPIAPLVLLLAVEGVRRLSERGALQTRAARAVLLAHGVTAAALFVAAPIVYPTDDWSHARAEMIQTLAADGGEHLVILRHGREYSPHEEWVYNAADIDASPVVWARELDSRSARNLRRHFASRRHWLLQAYRAAAPDGTPASVPTLVPYPELPDWLTAPPIRLLTGEPIATVAAADLDGDGRAEVIAAPVGRAVLEVFTAPNWTLPVTIPLPAPAAAVLVLNGEDGNGPTIAAALAGRSEVAIIQLRAGAEPEIRTLAIRGEGRGLAATGERGLIAVAVASPPGMEIVSLDSSEPASTWHNVGGEPHGVAVVDLTGDGEDDIVVSDRTGGAVWLLRGRREGGRWEVGEAEMIGRVPEALGVSALGLGDGRTGVAVASAATDSVVVLLADDAGAFIAHRLNTGVTPLAVAATDVDSDGRIDLAVATRFAHGLTVLRQLGRSADGAPTFAAPAEVTLGTQTWFVEKASRVAAADVDGDGIGDLIVGAVDGVHVLHSTAKPD